MSVNYDKYDLFESMDEYLTKLKFDRPKSKYFYPSEASVELTDQHGDKIREGGCMRASYFRLSENYNAEPHNARTQFIFRMGNMIEDDMVRIWKEMGIWHANSVKFHDEENNISGELDAVLVEPDTGQLYGVEVKSCYGYFAERELFGNKYKAGFPKMGQLLQTLVYLNYWQDTLPYFRMVYFARDSVKRKTFLIELHKEGDITFPKVDGVVIRSFTINDVLTRYKKLAHHIESNTIPPNDYELQYSDAKIEDFRPVALGGKGKVAKTKYEAFKKGKLKNYEYIGDWQCNYCSFKEVCWGNK